MIMIVPFLSIDKIQWMPYKRRRRFVSLIIMSCPLTVTFEVEWDGANRSFIVTPTLSRVLDCTAGSDILRSIATNCIFALAASGGMDEALDSVHRSVFETKRLKYNKGWTG